MKIFNSIEEIDITENTAVALGNFDGLHRGHMNLIRSMVEIAREAGNTPAVFTFSNHPSTLLSDEKVPEIIYKDEKAYILEKAGVELIFELPFTRDICKMPAEDYVRDLLISKFRMKDACCGFNYRFGSRAAGDTDLLQKMGRDLGFGVHIMDAFTVDGEVVSSTLIREAIIAGDMEKADSLLGRAYSIRGTVIQGNRLGRTIGFPTCNISIDEGMVAPPNGVYLTTCEVGGKVYDSITNVGVKPTIGDYEKSIETNIFDFTGDVYDEEIRVGFLKMIRREMKFPGIEELKKQIENDCISARKMHENR